MKLSIHLCGTEVSGSQKPSNSGRAERTHALNVYGAPEVPGEPPKAALSAMRLAERRENLLYNSRKQSEARSHDGQMTQRQQQAVKGVQHDRPLGLFSFNRRIFQRTVRVFLAHGNVWNLQQQKSTKKLESCKAKIKLSNAFCWVFASVANTQQHRRRRGCIRCQQNGTWCIP